MNQLAVISEAGLREAEFYGDFIELFPGAGWQSFGGGGGEYFAGRMEEGTSLYGMSPVEQAIYPNRNAAPQVGRLRVK